MVFLILDIVLISSVSYLSMYDFSLLVVFFCYLSSEFLEIIAGSTITASFDVET